MRSRLDRAGTGHRRRTCALLLVAFATLLGVLPAATAGASEPEADPAVAQPDVSVSEKSFERPGGTGRSTSTHFWISSKLGRGYFLTSKTATQPYDRIVAVDLETGGVAASEPLERNGYLSGGDANNVGTYGSDRSMAVDEDGDRLFVANQTPSATSTNAVTDVCLRPLATCLTGVSVIDAVTLQTLRYVPIRKVGVDGTTVGMELITMAFSPATPELGAKVYLLVEESVHAGEVNALAPFPPRSQSVVVQSLIQIDVDRGVQDWALRLDPCKGVLRLRGSTPNKQLIGLRHQSAILPGGPGDRSVYVACHLVSQTFQGGVVRVPLDESGAPPPLPVPLPQAPGPQADPAVAAEPPTGPPTVAMSDRVTWVSGPERVYEIIADPITGRIAFQVLSGKPLAQVWWVYDRATNRFVGTVGIGGPTDMGATLAEVDQGRLYVLTAEMGSFPGGLFVADIARTPVEQALVYPELADRFPAGYKVDTLNRWALSVQRLPSGSRRLWHPTMFGDEFLDRYAAIEDHRPKAVVPIVEDYAGRTLDLDEGEGLTSASLDGAARGYGMRVLLVGGLEAAGRVNAVDPLGTVDQCNDSVWDPTGPWGSVEANVRVQGKERAAGGPCHYLNKYVGSPCTTGDREIVIAAVGPDGPSVVDGNGARGGATPLRIDSLTGADVDTPLSRCAGQDWDQLWSTALFGRAPAGEPRIPLGLQELQVGCVSGGEVPRAQVGDPVVDGYSAHVACEEEEAAGNAYARGVGYGGITVAEALSSFRIYRDPGRGIVSRVESVARGLEIPGVLRIDAIRGRAESWANGRRQSVASAERDPGYRANCDYERTAGTCFQRQVFGLTSPVYSCGPCGDEHAFLDAVNAVTGPVGLLLQLRDPDARLRRGAENGFAAAIQKPEADRFGDLILNNDLLQTVLPTLEIIRQAPPNRVVSGGGGRGRQIYQFAGVEVSSSYGISCLLVYDEASNTCAAAKEAPGSITVSLTDADGKALAGGAFEVRQDADADGIVGLKDALIPDGACVTADDGVGTCSFENLQPGSYLVSQVAAPPGYGKVSDPFVVELGSGEARTVTFQNTSNVSTIAVSAADEAGKPVSGAVFAVYPDPDSDGKVAADAKPAASCTTDASGACSMSVPAGSYVLVQSSAPGGLEPIEPVAFTFASGGQTAAVGVVNYPAGTVPPVEPAASPIEYSAPPQPVVTETVAGYQPSTQVADQPQVSIPEAVGGTIVRVIAAPGDALRLLSRDPKQAVAWTASLMLFALAVLAVRRRQQAIALISRG
jgi:hypothetical protein